MPTARIPSDQPSFHPGTRVFFASSRTCVAAIAVWSTGIVLLIASGTACNTQVADSLSGTNGQAGSSPSPTAPSTEAATATANATAQATRDIEEADIIKVQDGKLYALNRYKGLIILDVSNPDAPALLGTLDLRGRGVEMYVADNRAYVVLSADYIVYAGGSAGAGGAPVESTAIAPGPPIPPPDFQGSQLGIIDISNPASPVMLNKVNLAGFASDSRRVGNIIYLVGANNYPFYLAEGSGTQPQGQVDEGFVASVNVADPSNVIAVERKTFSGNSLAIHVSQSLILAASQVYDSNAGGANTNVQTIDISDAAGAIAIRGSVQVPGVIRNRFYMDDFQGALRIATDSTGFGYQLARLFTYNLTDLDHITALGQVQIKQGETLQAVRFDGPRGYAVTFLRVDPLFVMDLRDPANPAVIGQLEAPGFSTYIQPRGDRLVAIGIDNTNGSRPAVAYYNVADPAHPSELGRVVLGPAGGFTDSAATYDEKAFKIVDELGLIAVPFHHVDYPNGGILPPSPGEPVPVATETNGSSGGGSNQTTASETNQPTCINAVQLVDLSDTALTQRGWFQHSGRVERVGAIDGRIFALSETAFSTVNIDDRDHPAAAGEVKFFSESDTAYYDDCGFIVGGVDTVPPNQNSGSLFDLMPLLNRFLCGTMTATPLLITTAFLMLIKVRSRRWR